MNKNRTLLLIISTICILFGLVFLFFQLRDINLRRAGADSGFDSSWDSGGSWDSGSSWDSSSSWDSDSSWDSSGGGDPIASLIIGGVIFLIFIIICCVNEVGYRRKERENGNNNLTFQNRPINYQVRIEKRVLTEADINLLNSYGLTEGKVYNDAFNAYVKIQKAWSENNIDLAKDYLSSTLYSQYKSQIVALVAKKQRNAMYDFKAIDSAILNIAEKDGSLMIDMILRVTCYDFLVSTVSDTVIRGDANKLNDYTYKLSFVISKDSKMLTHCPNCNAKLTSKAASVKCKYCGSTINRKTTSMVLERKEMLLQK